MTALKKIRIGTDAIIALSVNISGKPVTWSEGDIRHVYAFSDVQGQPVAEMAHKAEGQTLRCTYAAKDQNYTGPFRVIVEFADGKAFSSSLDVPAFEIVRTTEEADADTGEVVLDIDGTMRFYSLSEAIAKIEAATKAATDAAAAADRSAGNADAKATAANEAAVKANAAAKAAGATNTSIAEAEEQRVNAENARKEAELARADAEKARASAEDKRAEAEDKRAEAEEQRATGEQARVNAETGRVNAESARVKVESARDNAEATRAANEEQRKKNESARTSTEAGRVETEKGRVAAESARVAEFSRIKTESETATDDAAKAATRANDAAAKMRTLYEAEGAKYNEDTGYYELNGLTDITEGQMAQIYNESMRFPKNSPYIAGCYSQSKARTLFRPTTSAIISSNTSIGYENFFYSDNLEYIALAASSTGRSCSTLVYTFAFSGKLRKIDFPMAVVDKSFSSTFKECKLLEHVLISDFIGGKLSFIDSPRLNYTSLRWLVDKAKNTTAETVTVHATTYGYLTGITPPSEQVGGTSEQWTQLMADAAARKISFATA
jgi:hypothetical protein|nr:MAG TPA: hypothetical protein [Caudoviricetes sp.]